MDKITITVEGFGEPYVETLDAELCLLWMAEQGLVDLKSAIGRFTLPILERGLQLKAKAEFEEAANKR